MAASDRNRSTRALGFSTRTILFWSTILILPAIVTCQESCLPFNITKGETLEANCAAHCSPDISEHFDWAAPNETDPNILDRNIFCRCKADEETVTFECSDVEEGVWDKTDATDNCDDFNITSGTTCKNFCKDIDTAFKYKGSGSNVQCWCASPPVKICGSGATLTGPGLFVVLCSAIQIILFLVNFLT